MVPWLAGPAWMPTPLPSCSCMGGSKRVFRIARDCTCDRIPGLDPRGVAAGRERPIHRGGFWRGQLVADLLWESWPSDVSLAPDGRLCGTVHAHVVGPGVHVIGWWPGFINYRQNATTSDRHGTGAYDATSV